MAEQYYYGRYWESFSDPVVALVVAGFPIEFARAEIKAAGWNDVFVAFDDEWGVRLVYDGGRWDRWYVRFDPLLATNAAALYEGRRLVVPATVSEVTSLFTWNGTPRRPTLNKKKPAGWTERAR